MNTVSNAVLTLVEIGCIALLAWLVGYVAGTTAGVVHYQYGCTSGALFVSETHCGYCAMRKDILDARYGRI